MKKIITISIIIIIAIVAIFLKLGYKNNKIGNNTNKSADEIKNYILDISSYKANFSVEIKSNKNTNKYVIEEEYIKDSNYYKQEVQEPENIKGLKIVYSNNELKIENTKLNLSKIYENYKYIGENIICLSSFIEDFKENDKSKIEENESEVILKTKVKNGDKYINSKTLYIDKKTLKPTKLEINDKSQNTKIYILYNEIEINNLQKEDVLAFKLDAIKNDI